MRASMQQSAMDARTGMIDMDKLYSGVGAIDRETRKHLAGMISEMLIGAHCTLSSVQRPCKPTARLHAVRWPLPLTSVVAGSFHCHQAGLWCRGSKPWNGLRMTVLPQWAVVRESLSTLVPLTKNAHTAACVTRIPLCRRAQGDVGTGNHKRVQRSSGRWWRQSHSCPCTEGACRYGERALRRRPRPCQGSIVTLSSFWRGLVIAALMRCALYWAVHGRWAGVFACVSMLAKLPFHACQGCKDKFRMFGHL